VEISRAAQLQTPRLRLVPIAEADAAELTVVLDDPRLHEFIGGSPQSEPELRARFRRWVAGSGKPAELWLNWVVRLAADGAAVGTLQATLTRRSGPAAPWSAEVAWVIGVPWQGQGFAAEAAVALVTWLTGAGVTDISACVHPQHQASQRVARRAGLTPTSEVVDGEQVWRAPPGAPLA
jgi:RimJ/RimL family protein N-acetyltransferase